MHDAIVVEKLGTPALGIMTAQFVGAAQLMARVLGAEDYRFAVVDHPISSASVEELATRADRAARDGNRLLTANGD